MSPTLPRVCVLLSTYNPATSLRAQLDSLRAQTGVQLQVQVRDDGSDQPASLRHLQALAAGYPEFHWQFAGHLGMPGGFLTQLAAATATDGADYYAFCDQDDVWLPDKLASAIAALQTAAQAAPELPLLYCSRQQYVDAALRPLGLSPALQGPAHLDNALVENLCTGCTAVFNRPLLLALQAPRLLERLHHPRARPLLHDWWCYLVASALGRVILDDRARLLYRQHAGNLIGGRRGPWQRLRRRWQAWVGEGRVTAGWAAQARLFGELYASRLTPAQQARITAVAALDEGRRGPALAALLSGRLRRQRLADQLALALAIGLTGGHRGPDDAGGH